MAKAPKTSHSVLSALPVAGEGLTVWVRGKEVQLTAGDVARVDLDEPGW
jgi:hypothetical protein